MGCDPSSKNGIVCRRTFQSMHPVWGATLKRFALSSITSLFQSTHPVWGATSRRALSYLQRHYFNPRTPYGVRRFTIKIIAISQNFNPRTPYGVRLLRIKIIACHKAFQSTHPVWGATRVAVIGIILIIISIHAPRMGCDIHAKGCP